jgi:hypothetical protein
MQGYTDYNWEALLELPALAMAPEGLLVHIFDGGHRLAAAQLLQLGTWPVVLFPRGKRPNLLSQVHAESLLALIRAL